ncbi:MAG TPA: heavy metal-associated domain-containing protein, partial [Bacteroidia bacterium]|nr:heavy metal-associated domain-containing protein [Bacteroidia bacterium]
FLCASVGLKAQEKTEEISIKSSIVCGMCKRNVEKALRFKGIEKTTVNLQAETITVVYDPKVTSPDKIKSAISKAGYDADEVKADPKAFKKLDKCCQKGNEHP